MTNRLRLSMRLTSCFTFILCLACTCTALGYDGPWPKFFDYTVGPAHYGTTAHDCSEGINRYGFYSPATDPLRNLITPVPRPGAYLPWDHEQITTCYDRVLQQERPLTINLNSYTFPLGDNPNAENRDPQALSKTMDYLSGLPAQASIPNSEGRLDYVLMDLEPSWQSTANANVAEAVNQVRAHSNPRINQAKVGNYNYFPCSTLPWLPYPYQNSSSRQQMVNGAYDSTGVNVAMPSLYPYEYYEVHTRSSSWGSQVAPNKRSALFWAPLAKLSETKKSLPAGHELIPYMNNMVQYTDDSYHADPPTKEDCAALLQHTRLRGADGYYIWRTYAFEMEDGTPYSYDNDEYRGDMLNAWTSLDWLYAGTSQPQILNLETDKLSGLQWSTTVTDQGVAVLVSNMGNSSVWFDMPDVGAYNNHLIDGFEIAPGTHRLETYHPYYTPPGPGPVATGIYSENVTAPVLPANNLIVQGSDTFEGSYAGGASPATWGTQLPDGMNNGVMGDCEKNPPYDILAWDGVAGDFGWAVYRLDTSVNTDGYDLSEILSYAAWSGARVNQAVEIKYALVGDTVTEGEELERTLGKFYYLPSDNSDSGTLLYTTMSIAYEDGSTMLSGISAIEVKYIDNLFNGQNGDTNDAGNYTAYKQFAVIGTPTIPELPGDANHDGKVDGSDVTILAGNWQTGVGAPDPSTITWEMGDFNGDGQVDGSDVTILAGNWQAGVTAAMSVPESSTIILIMMAAMSLLVAQRKL